MSDADAMVLTEPPVYRCVDCGETFVTERGAHKHAHDGDHGFTGVPVCDYCDRSLDAGIVADGDGFYCSEKCAEQGRPAAVDPAGIKRSQVKFRGRVLSVCAAHAAELDTADMIRQLGKVIVDLRRRRAAAGLEDDDAEVAP